MKKIYTFTLNGGNQNSDAFNSNLRLFAYMVYSSMDSFCDLDVSPLDINDIIVYNEIHEQVGGRVYFLDSDLYDDGVIQYEPFIVGKNSFALTINDDLVKEDKIVSLVNYIKRLLHFNYDVSINAFEYESKDINDEDNREVAINSVYNYLGCELPRKYNFVTRLFHGVNKKKK